MERSREAHFAFLDGLRGLMALWVLYGHTKMACIGTLPAVGSPAMAVDVFMLLSGFLMLQHWDERQATRGSNFQTACARFYVRRFFRIAPLYYLAFAIACVGYSAFDEKAHALALLVPPPWADQVAEVVVPNKLTLADVAAHLSFTFGFFPRFVSSNILPDWSIGLEMQFYAAFPLIALAFVRLGPLPIVVGSCALAFITKKAFGLYLAAGPLGTFPQPGFLGFKLHLFVVGMLIADAHRRGRNKAEGGQWLLLIAALMSLREALQFQLCALAVMFLLLYPRTSDPVGLTRVLDALDRLLSGRVARFLGDTSFAVYLVHNLFLVTLLHWLFQQSWFTALDRVPRLATTIGMLFPIVYGTAYILFHTVERPGIRLGGQIARRLQASDVSVAQGEQPVRRA